MEGIKFLLVDDETDILELGAEMLELEDQLVQTAENGQKALDIIAAGEIPQVVISDFNMPVMGGLDLLKGIIEKFPNESERPLFYFSTGAIDFTEDEAKGHGATGVIYKPFDFDDVLERVKTELSKG